MRKDEIIFSPLGGGQRVGASCYYLCFRNHHILLDAGIDSNKRTPVWSHLLGYHRLTSMNQIEQIYISHAHMDHIGSLFGMMSQCSQASVYMTAITKSLAELQIYDRIYFNSLQNDEKKRIAAKNCLDRITVVSYMKTMDFHDYRVTFYPAGHIPGAMMTLLELPRCNILYTGDYSISESPLCLGCTIPSNKKIDVVILCGLHAKHPDYQKKKDVLFQKIRKIFYIAETNRRSVQCCVNQLSKGVEFLKLLNEKNTSGIPILVDESIMQVVRKMEQNGFQILSKYNRLVSRMSAAQPCIYLTSGNRTLTDCYERLDIDFTLHEDFEEMKQFIKSINPKHVYLVHCAPPVHEEDITIEQALLWDTDCRVQFTFAQDESIYYI